MQPPTPSFSPPLPQAHSRDYFVRMTADALRGIVFEHHCTLQDTTVLDGAPAPTGGDCRAGITEWVGVAADGVRISLGWDWLQLDDGEAQPLTDVPPRSNLMVIDRRGYDLPLSALVDHLWATVGQIPWKGVVAEAAEPEFGGLLEAPALLM